MKRLRDDKVFTDKRNIIASSALVVVVVFMLIYFIIPKGNSPAKRENTLDSQDIEFYTN